MSLESRANTQNDWRISRGFWSLLVYNTNNFGRVSRGGIGKLPFFMTIK